MNNGQEVLPNACYYRKGPRGLLIPVFPVAMTNYPKQSTLKEGKVHFGSPFLGGKIHHGGEDW